MLRKVFGFILAFLIYFLICEQIVRFEMFGMNSFSPKLMQNIRLSESSPFLDDGCDLKTHYQEYLKGAYLETNSIGLRDKEYSFTKPPRTYRIAIIGDSDTVGEGVEADKVYPEVFENKLNEIFNDQTYEVINFARSGLQTPRKKCYVKKTADSLYFEPDLIMIQVYAQHGLFEDPENLEILKKYSEYAPIVLFYFNKSEDELEELRQLTKIPIISLNVSHTQKDIIFPADWHVNEKIHAKYADSLYAYFLSIKDSINQQQFKPIIKSELPKFRIPARAIRHQNPKSGFLKSYYFQKIEKRFPELFKD